MSQRISFVLSDFHASRQRTTSPFSAYQPFGASCQQAHQAGLHGQQHQHHPPTAPVHEPQSRQPTPQHQAIDVLEAPSLPKRRSPVCMCLGIVVGLWCLATIGMAIAFFIQGRSWMTSTSPVHHDVSNLILPRMHRERLATADCLFSVVVDGPVGTTRSEIVTALGIVTGVPDDVDLDVTVTKLSTAEFNVSVKNCDSSLAYALGNESLKSAWALRLKSFRGGSVEIHGRES